METQSTSLKILFVGDSSVGKTSIIHSYLFDCLPSQSTLTALDNQTKALKLEGQSYNLSIWQPSPDPSFDLVRPIVQSNVDIVIIVFSVNDPSSYHHSYGKWLQQVFNHSPQALFVFVANKIDLRQTNHKLSTVYKQMPERSHTYIDRQIGKQAARKKIEDELGYIYCECSALTREGIAQVYGKSIGQWNSRISKAKQRTEAKRVKTRSKGLCCCCQIM